MGKFIDLTGQTFGRWQVIERVYPKGKDNIAWWKCVCSCEKHTVQIIRSQTLRSGKSKSCGCIDKEKYEKVNRYVLKDGYYEVYNRNGDFFLIDEEDYERVKQYRWSISIHKDGSKRVCAMPKDRKQLGHMSLLYHFILNEDNDCLIDHINRNPLDNRKSNLRKCTPVQNGQNSSLRVDNKSGVKGVWYDKVNNKWASEIKVAYRKIFLGRFIEKEDAIIARLRAEKEYFGEFSANQDLFEKYNI